MKKILILSDTHGHWPGALNAQAGWADELWHAGDFGPGVAEVDISTARSAKTLAMAAHASQGRNRSLDAGMAGRDLAQAVLSRITGDEPRRAVERLVDLSALGRQRPAPASAAEARARMAAWTRQHFAAWATSLGD